MYFKYLKYPEMHFMILEASFGLQSQAVLVKNPCSLPHQTKLISNKRDAIKSFPNTVTQGQPYLIGQPGQPPEFSPFVCVR